jgi:hypothetical protein
MPKRMNKAYCYPTQVYFTGLAEAETLNPNFMPAIHAWRETGPDGMSGRISDTLELTISHYRVSFLLA